MEARTLNLIGLCHLALGHAERAAAAVESAERLFVTEGQHVESVVTLHNRGRIAYCRGDLPAALRLYDEAAERYAALGEDPARAVNDQCEALLAAGLAHEAADLVIRRVAGASLPADVLAELLLNESMAELADNQPAAAVASATERGGVPAAASRVVGAGGRAHRPARPPRVRDGRAPPRAVRRQGGDGAGGQWL